MTGHKDVIESERTEDAVTVGTSAGGATVDAARQAASDAEEATYQAQQDEARARQDRHGRTLEQQAAADVKAAFQA